MFVIFFKLSMFIYPLYFQISYWQTIKLCKVTGNDIEYNKIQVKKAMMLHKVHVHAYGV